MSICDPHKCSWHFSNRVFTHKLGNTAINIIPRSSEKHTTKIKGMERTHHYLLYSLAIKGSIWGSWRSSAKKYDIYNQTKTKVSKQYTIVKKQTRDIYAWLSDLQANSASLSLIFLIRISARVRWRGAFLTKNDSNNF